MFRKIYNKLQRIVGWWRKVSVHWETLPESNIIIFETTNIDYLLPICGKYSYKPLEVPIVRLSLSLSVIINTIKFALRGYSVKVAYYGAVIRQINPCIVITFIDNSDLFYSVAMLLHTKIRFLAIQNAARYDVLELSNDEAKRIFIPEFACFGEYEKDMYLDKEAKVEHFYPIGSLRESYFREYWAKSNNYDSSRRYDYDLCVVAEASPGWDKIYPGFEDAIGRIAQFAVRLSREKGFKLVIAGKRDVVPDMARAQIHSRNSEVDWYETYIGDEVPIAPRIRNQYTTYGLIKRSRLSLAMVSTALREGASRGDRVLFCNYSGDSLWDFAVDGLMSIKEDSYEAFSKRVMTILNLNDDEYAAQTSETVKYVIDNNSIPTSTALEEMISSAVTGR